MKRSIACLVAAVLLLLPVSASGEGGATQPVLGSWEERVAALADPDGRLMSCAHRGFWANDEAYPENSVPAILEAGAVGVDIVEVDVKKTSDGTYILLHDNTFWRTANLNAHHQSSDWPQVTEDGVTKAADKPWQLTLEQVRRLRLREGAGGDTAAVTTYVVPTLTEALTAAKQAGVILLLDQAWDEMAGICAVIDDAEAWQYCMFQSGDTTWSAKLEAQRVQYNAASAPYFGLFFNRNTPALVADAVESYFDAQNPAPAWTYLNAAGLSSATTAAEYVQLGTNAAMIAQAQGRTRIFLNTLVSGPSVDNRAVWEQLYAGGVNIIQTDNPAALVAYIRDLVLGTTRYGYEGAAPVLAYGGGGSTTPQGKMTGSLVSVRTENRQGEGLYDTALKLTVTDPTFAAGHDTGWLRAICQTGSTWDIDWTGAQEVKFYVDASSTTAPLRLHFALMGTQVGTATTGVWGEIKPGATVYCRSEGQTDWTALTVQDNAYVLLDSGFKGWVCVSLRNGDLRAVWGTQALDITASLWRVVNLCVSVSGNAAGTQPSSALVGQPVYVDSFIAADSVR